MVCANTYWVRFSSSNVGKGIFFFLQIREHRRQRGRGGAGGEGTTSPPPRKHREGENWLQNVGDIMQGTQPEPFQFLILVRQAPYTSLNGLISVIWVYILCLSNFLARLSCCSANGYRLGVIGKTWLGLEWYGGKIPKSNLCVYANTLKMENCISIRHHRDVWQDVLLEKVHLSGSKRI